jgi:hypothetical protein
MYSDSLKHITIINCIKTNRKYSHVSESRQEMTYTGHTQNNGAVLIVNTIKTAPFFCVYPVFLFKTNNEQKFNCIYAQSQSYSFILLKNR